MEERVRHMTTLGTKTNDISAKIKQSCEQGSQTRQRGVDRDKMQENMKKRMQRKQLDRRKKSGGGEESGMLGEYPTEDDVYQNDIPDNAVQREGLKQDIQIEADMTDAMVAMLHVVDEHEREEEQSKVLEKLESSLQGKLAGESSAIMSAYAESVEAVSKKLSEEKSKANDNVAERLAARKRLREELYNKQVNEEVINEVGLAKVCVLELCHHTQAHIKTHKFF